MKYYLFFVMYLFCVTGYCQAPTEEYYQNGVLKSTGKYINKMQEGIWKFYNLDGSMESSGNYTNGKMNGIWNYYYKSGAVNVTGNFDNDLKEGVWKTFDETGKLILSGKYEKGLESGEWKSFFPNGQVADIMKYNAGKLNGDFKSYFADGKLAGTGKYVNNIKIGQWIYYHQNGQIAEKGNYEAGSIERYDAISKDFYTVVQALKIGEWNSYHDNGQLSITGYYEKDKKTGPWLYYGVNGNVILKGSYKYDRPIGEWIGFYNNGNPLLKGKYQQDIVKRANRADEVHAKSIGSWIAYWEDGSEAKQYDFNDNDSYLEKVMSTKFNDKFVYPDGGYGKGKTVMSLTLSINRTTQKVVVDFEQIIKSFGSFYRYGKWEEYTKDGWKYAEGEYNWKTNKQDGFWTFFNNKGNITATKVYKDGVLDGATTYFRENGKKSSEVTMVKGNLTAVTAWDQNGNVEEKSFGDGNGLVNRVYYYPNGTKKSFGTDLWNQKEKKYQRQGNWTYNFENGNKQLVEVYKNGILTKMWEMYLKNGEKILSDGNGEHKTFYDNGQLSFSAIIKNGARDGVTTWYYDNGQIQQSLLYQYDAKSTPVGKRMEILSSFAKDGTPRNKGTLKNGNGTLITYNEKGEAAVETYKDGYKVP